MRKRRTRELCACEAYRLAVIRCLVLALAVAAPLVVATLYCIRPLQQLILLRAIEDSGGTILYDQGVDGQCQGNIVERLFGVAGVSVVRFGQGSAVTTYDLRVLSGLSRLDIVELDDAQIDDTALHELARSRSISSLSLNGTCITDVGLREIGTTCPIEILYVRGTKVTDEGVIHLCRLSDLAVLDLGGTGVTDMGAVHLSCLDRLEWLSLQGCDVTDSTLAELKSLSQLRYLDVRNTRVSRDAAAVFQERVPGVNVRLEGE